VLSVKVMFMAANDTGHNMLDNSQLKKLLPRSAEDWESVHKNSERGAT
jgi:hypothetical protein